MDGFEECQTRKGGHANRVKYCILQFRAWSPSSYLEIPVLSLKATSRNPAPYPRLITLLITASSTEKSNWVFDQSAWRSETVATLSQVGEVEVKRMAMATSSNLKLYLDLMSQPSRAVLLFCKVNNIDVELNLVNIQKGMQNTPEFKAINPLGKVPCIVDGRFKLSESHAIMQYLASTRPGVADHWYPSDVQRRVKIQSILDWHQLNLRRGSMTLVFNKVIAPMLGAKLDPRAAAEGLAILEQSLHVMETVWLEEGYPFLAGGRQPSIADMSLVCEIMQLQLLGEDEVAALLSSKQRVTAWISAVKKATSPHFDEVNKIVYRSAARRAQSRQAGTGRDFEDTKRPISKL